MSLRVISFLLDFELNYEHVFFAVRNSETKTQGLVLSH
jgi:hypothetical protein